MRPSDDKDFGDIAQLRRRLMAFALKKNSKHEAEDLVQTTFVKMCASRDRFTPGSDPFKWAATIMTNTRHDARKSLRHRREFCVGDFDALRPQAPENPETSVYCIQVLDAMTRLSPLQEEALTRHALGYGDVEVSATYGLNRNAHYERLRRGRVALAGMVA